MSFQITVQPSGRSFSAEADEFVLAAAIRQGIGMPYGCRDGACGSCKCKKLEGQVEHGPHQSKALNEMEEANGMMLACCAKPLSDLILESRQVTLSGAFAIKKMPARVLSLAKKAPDVMLVRIQLPASDTLQYHAGQFLEIILRDGDRRSYSMANAPHTLGPLPPGTPSPGVEFHIRYMAGGKFTEHVFASMKDKEILRVEGPYGSFYLREESSKPIIFLASGTGFAPIKAVIEHMAHKGIAREATLYWGGRRPMDLYLEDWVKQRLTEMPHLRYVPVISDALPEDAWSGRTGFVHRAVLQDFPDLSKHQVYVCGAPIVVDSARADFIKLAGLPEEDFFADSFVTAADKAKS